jgi:hypothetical protein
MTSDDPLPRGIGPVVLRWSARGLSVLLVGFVLLMAAGEHPNLIAVIRSTRGLFLVFPFAVCIGMVMAWRWELAGGVLSLVSLGLFYTIEFVQSGRLPRGPFLLMFGGPAILFLASRAWRNKTVGKTRG